MWTLQAYPASLGPIGRPFPWQLHYTSRRQTNHHGKSRHNKCKPPNHWQSPQPQVSQWQTSSKLHATSMQHLIQSEHSNHTGDQQYNDLLKKSQICKNNWHNNLQHRWQRTQCARHIQLGSRRALLERGRSKKCRPAHPMQINKKSLSGKRGHKQSSTCHTTTIPTTLPTSITGWHIQAISNVTDEHWKNIRWWHNINIHQTRSYCTQRIRRSNHMQRQSNPDRGSRWTWKLLNPTFPTERTVATTTTFQKV